jgi:hypothetical protein
MEISVDEADDRPVWKISSETTEVNVYFQTDDPRSLLNVSEADWNARKSIQCGTSAGQKVWWSCDSGSVTLLIGHDDESWDIALGGIPLKLVTDAASQ